ncbi:MAG: flagellar hook-length control protein FliK [Verrucomicrobia bacterium]|nr:flagellar hook-length control protein FliK [Verrucomicrobiota bacterium]
MNPVSDRTQSSNSVDSKSTENNINPVAQPVDAAAVAKLKKLVSSQDENSGNQSDTSDPGASLLNPNLPQLDPSVIRLTPMQPVNAKTGASNAQKTALVSPFDVSTANAQKTPLASPFDAGISENASVPPTNVSRDANPPASTTTSTTTSANEVATELAKALVTPKPDDVKQTEKAADSTQNQSTQNLVNPANASVQQVVNTPNQPVTGTPNAPASTDHTALINSVADQLLVSEAKQGAGSQVQIRMNQNILPDTQVTLKHENGQLTVNFVSGAQSSSDLLANGAETLANRLANMGSVPVVVTVRQTGATDGLLASVTAQAQTGSDQSGFGRSRGRQWSEQVSDDTSASS